MVPGLKFSSKISDFFNRFIRISLASGFFRFKTMLCLFRFKLVK